MGNVNMTQAKGLTPGMPVHAVPDGRPPWQAHPKSEGYSERGLRTRRMRSIKYLQASGWAGLMHPFPQSDDLANKAIHGWPQFPASCPITQTSLPVPLQYSKVLATASLSSGQCLSGLCQFLPLWLFLFFFFYTTLGGQLFRCFNTLRLQRNLAVIQLCYYLCSLCISLCSITGSF